MLKLRRDIQTKVLASQFNDFIFFLAWEASIAWKLNFRYKSESTQLRTLNQVKNISIVLPSSDIQTNKQR